MRKVIIHYHRADRNYEPWGVWLWPEGYGGSWVKFSETDYFGMVAICEVAKEHKRIGFVIRGASWEKDVDQDRYFDEFVGDVGEIWLISGDPKIYLAPPAHLRERVRSFPELEITFHYYRYDGNYEGWNLWIWGPREQGSALEFTAGDAFGAVARLVLQEQTDASGLGFVLRRSVLGNAWLEKDGGDRELPFFRASEEGKLQVWLMQDDPRIYYLEKDVDREPKIILATLDGVQTIRVECHLPIKEDLGPKWGFRLFTLDGEVVLGEVHPWYRQGKGPKSFVLKTREALDLNTQYELRHKTHGKAPVTFGKVFDSKEFEVAFHYSGTDLGVTYTPQQTTFKVWAPTATSMEVILYEEGEGGKGVKAPLELGEKGVWSGSILGDLEGKFYNFLVSHGEQTEEVVDPYATATGINGLRGQIVDLEQTNPPGWQEVQWIPLENPVDAVIYEVHVRDFSSSPTSGIAAKGQYLGLIEAGSRSPSGVVTGIDHLKELGVTHVHLLPIFDFATVDEAQPQASYNWGYDPLNFNVPEGSYASDPRDGKIRILELKTMIQGLNQAGFSVVMDVVYNHTFHSVVSSFHKLVPGYYYRHHEDGSFSNGSGCGNELADERSMVRKFIVDSVSYWAREYKVAGFRFDLMGLHHIQTMQAVRQALDVINPEILLYGEGWAAAQSTLPEYERALKENTPQLTGVASFCNDLRDGIKGHVFHTAEGGFIQGTGQKETVKFGITGAVKHPQIDYGKVLYSNGPWAKEPSQSVIYVEAHDNLTLWDKLLCTTPYESQDERIKLMKLAHVIILISQGIPFLHAGQEFARTKGGDPNSYQSPDHVNQVDWERKGEFRELFEYTKKLIELRKKRLAFRIREGREVRDKLRFLDLPDPNLIGFALGPNANGDSYETILVFLNSNPWPLEITIDAGSWDLLVNGEDVGELGTLVGPQATVEARSALILGRRGKQDE
ncbi:MAG: type I pullulanase [Firmicutes bacterium]|nr:type I pullulanase [Bacillota bacterium]